MWAGREAGPQLRSPRLAPTAHYAATGFATWKKPTTPEPAASAGGSLRGYGFRYMKKASHPVGGCDARFDLAALFVEVAGRISR
jgi:hypothetical protein